MLNVLATAAPLAAAEVLGAIRRVERLRGAGGELSRDDSVPSARKLRPAGDDATTVGIIVVPYWVPRDRKDEYETGVRMSRLAPIRYTDMNGSDGYNGYREASFIAEFAGNVMWHMQCETGEQLRLARGEPPVVTGWDSQVVLTPTVAQRLHWNTPSPISK